jgi:phosphoribosylglycinamide formyltransferase-1
MTEIAATRAGVKGAASAAPERFVSEAIVPSIETCDTSLMASGGPGLPREFRWRGRPLAIKSVLRMWSDTGPCRNGSGEQYVRKHWFEVISSDDEVMKVYFDRQPRGGAKAPRWWLFSIGGERGTST